VLTGHWQFFDSTFVNQGEGREGRPVCHHMLDLTRTIELMLLMCNRLTQSQGWRAQAS
jgi:hypothetical protein